MFEIEKNAALTSVLIAFAILTFVYRYWDSFFRSYGNPGKIYFGLTVYLLAFVHSLIGILSFLEYFFLRNSYNWLVGGIFFAIFMASQFLRNWAISSLGQNHSPHIEIRPNHFLVKMPPYSYVRNPYYLGVTFEVLTAPLVLNAYCTFAFSIVCYLPILFFRVVMEEKILRDHFGSAYVEYEKKTPRFIPCLWRR